MQTGFARIFIATLYVSALLHAHPAAAELAAREQTLITSIQKQEPQAIALLQEIRDLLKTRGPA